MGLEGFALSAEDERPGRSQKGGKKHPKKLEGAGKGRKGCVFFHGFLGCWDFDGFVLLIWMIFQESLYDMM